jgi:hypothetical protein
MSDDGAARIRRRWITLGEVLAVAGVVISALALWNSWAERDDNARQRAAEAAEKRAVSHVLLLRASGGGRRLVLAPRDAGQLLQGQTLLFPSALGVGPIETTDGRIEAEWVKRAVKKAHEDDETKTAGDARLPVGIATRFTGEGGETLTDTALYDIGYKEEGGGLLGGSDVALRGVSLIRRVKAAEAQKRLDALWAGRTAPKPSPPRHSGEGRNP